MARTQEDFGPYPKGENPFDNNNSLGFKVLDSARSPTLLSSVGPVTEQTESNMGAQ